MKATRSEFRTAMVFGTISPANSNATVLTAVAIATP